MKKGILYILPCVLGVLAAPAHANWQYPGTYVGDGWYQDDGSRFIMSARAGGSLGVASIKNEIGSLTPLYYISPDGGEPFPEILCINNDCANFVPAGYADLGKLPVNKDFDSFAFAAGASIGFTMPNHPQWRLEGGWDHIAKTEYNASPFLDGRTTLFGGDVSTPVDISSGGVQSELDTDIISVMAFYDFFDGLHKPLNTVIPYVGFGMGYADVKTTLNLSDPYGDLSGIYELLAFGQRDENTVIQFYKSEHSNSTVAGLLSLGVSYGISEGMFLDFGARVMYVPKVKWTLSNENDSRHRDWFAAENLIYANIMLGLRFEF